MNKDETLKSLENAKIELIRFVEIAKIMASGIEPENKILPTTPRETKFGKWFYTDGQKLKTLSNNPLECMDNIESLHEKFYEKYHEIYDVYYSEENKSGFFSKIFKPKQKVLTDSELQHVKQEFAVMEKTAKKLLEEISRLQRRLVAVSEEKIHFLGHL